MCDLLSKNYLLHGVCDLLSQNSLLHGVCDLLSQNSLLHGVCDLLSQNSLLHGVCDLHSQNSILHGVREKVDKANDKVFVIYMTRSDKVCFSFTRLNSYVPLGLTLQTSTNNSASW